MAATPDYNCPGCGLPSDLVISPQQAFCMSTNGPVCKVICWNPSAPASTQEIKVIDVPDLLS